MLIMNLGNFANSVFCSFNKLLLQKEELEQKHLHLLQVQLKSWNKGVKVINFLILLLGSDISFAYFN